MTIFLRAAFLTLPFISTWAFAQNTPQNAFNPSIGLSLDGRYFAQNHEQTLPGFILQGEAAHERPEGFSLGHSELTISSNIDQLFYGSMALALSEHEGDIELELEEAFVETTSLSHGLKVKGGKFFSSLGYLNQQHMHQQDFTDRPLAYDAILGGQLADTGVQLSAVLPTDFYWQVGGEWLSGQNFPGGENSSGVEAFTLFNTLGGDFTRRQSWQLGLAVYGNQYQNRDALPEHDHHEEPAGHSHEMAIDDGDNIIGAIGFVYKWRLSKQQNLQLQSEYLYRKEQGTWLIVDENEQADFKSRYHGFYIQGVYQFSQYWRSGLRFDAIKAKHQFATSDAVFIAETTLEENPNSTQALTVMFDYRPSHFSTLRLQVGANDNGADVQNRVSLQYLMSLGAHTSHSY